MSTTTAALWAWSRRRQEDLEGDVSDAERRQRDACDARDAVTHQLAWARARGALEEHRRLMHRLREIEGAT